MKCRETTTIVCGKVPRWFVESSFVSLWNEWKLQTKISLILSPTILAHCHLHFFGVFFLFQVECKNSHYCLNRVVKHFAEVCSRPVRCKHLPPCKFALTRWSRLGCVESWRRWSLTVCGHSAQLPIWFTIESLFFQVWHLKLQLHMSFCCFNVTKNYHGNVESKHRIIYLVTYSCLTFLHLCFTYSTFIYGSLIERMWFCSFLPYAWLR